MFGDFDFPIEWAIQFTSPLGIHGPLRLGGQERHRLYEYSPRSMSALT